jgi:hypothetical protein
MPLFNFVERTLIGVILSEGRMNFADTCKMHTGAISATHAPAQASI